jgi:hypothetical protein
MTTNKAKWVVVVVMKRSQWSALALLALKSCPLLSVVVMVMEREADTGAESAIRALPPS